MVTIIEKWYECELVVKGARESGGRKQAGGARFERLTAGKPETRMLLWDALKRRSDVQHASGEKLQYESL